jgi:DNA (cytosine-5)-methyltransferase 1
MYVDLFAGCGGLSLGLHNAGWRGLFAIEKNADAFATLRHNLIINREHFAWPDWLNAENIDINDLLETHRNELMALRNHVDLVVGGPPCQGFSMAGERKGNDVRNRLYNVYINFVELVQPRMLFFENVHGFTVGFNRKYRGQEKKGEPYSEKLVKALEKLGYRVASRVILVSEYGVPQKRKRFILFAIRNQNPEEFFTKLQNNKHAFLEQKGLEAHVSVKDAIGDLERCHGEVPSIDTSGFMNGVYGPINSNYQRLMRGNVGLNIIPNSHRFAKQKNKTIELLEKLMNVSNEAIRITPHKNLVEGLKKRGVTPLKSECICPTITSIPDDFVHYSEPRIMTVRENARIQSFPDDYEFLGKYTTGGERRKVEVPRYTQVANAVPPLFAEQVGIVLREMLENE